MEKEKKEEEGASSGKSASKHDWQKHAFFEKKKIANRGYCNKRAISLRLCNSQLC